jgi:hypothetical protein
MDQGQIQNELLEQALQACDTNNIDKTKSLVKLIDFNSSYHKNYYSAEQIFTKACLSGSLDMVEALIDLTRHSKEDNNVLNYAFERLIKSNDEKNYHIITHLMNRPKLQANRSRKFLSVVNWGLKFSAQNDNANLFKLLLNFNQTRKNNTWFFESLGIYNYAYENNHEGNIIKYIFTEPLLVDYVNPHTGFLRACQYEHIKALQFFIFEYKIKKNEVFTDPNDDTYQTAIQMFELRDLNENLNNKLPQNQYMSKKTKV